MRQGDLLLRGQFGLDLSALVHGPMGGESIGSGQHTPEGLLLPIGETSIWNTGRMGWDQRNCPRVASRLPLTHRDGVGEVQQR